MLVGIAIGAVLILLVLLRYGNFWLMRWRLRGIPTTRIRRVPSNPNRPYQVDASELHAVIELFLGGDAHDMLWISWSPDKKTGLMLSQVAGPPLLTVIFQTQSQQPQQHSFKQAMLVLGLEAAENATGFNGGVSEKHRVTVLRYPMPPSAAGIEEAVTAAAANLNRDVPMSWFVSATNFASLDPDTHCDKPADPLAELLGNRR